MVHFSIAPQADQNGKVDLTKHSTATAASVYGQAGQASYVQGHFDLKPGKKETLFEHSANLYICSGNEQEEKHMFKNVYVKTDGHDHVEIHAGHWRIPLVRNQTPVLRFMDGLYIVAQQSALNGRDLLIDFRPYNISNESLVTLECLFRYYAVLEVRSGQNFVFLDEGEHTADVDMIPTDMSPKDRKNARKTDYIIKGGVVAAGYVQIIGDQATTMMQGRADKKRAKLTEAKMGGGDVDQKTIRKLEKTSKGADTLLKGANLLTGTIGAVVGKGAAKAGTYGGKHAVDSEGEETKRGAMLRTAGAGMIAWNTVWEASEAAGMGFLEDTEKETADYYYKVYGPNGAEAASLACRSTAKTAKAGYKIGTIGPKQVMKAGAKEAGKAVTANAYDANPNAQGTLGKK